LSARKGDWHELMADSRALRKLVAAPVSTEDEVMLMSHCYELQGKRSGAKPDFTALTSSFNSLVPELQARGFSVKQKTITQLTNFYSELSRLLAGYHHMIEYCATSTTRLADMVAAKKALSQLGAPVAATTAQPVRRPQLAPPPAAPAGGGSGSGIEGGGGSSSSSNASGSGPAAASRSAPKSSKARAEERAAQKADRAARKAENAATCPSCLQARVALHGDRKFKSGPQQAGYKHTLGWCPVAAAKTKALPMEPDEAEPTRGSSRLASGGDWYTTCAERVIECREQAIPKAAWPHKLGAHFERNRRYALAAAKQASAGSAAV
jgi:hypothetical protein